MTRGPGHHRTPPLQHDGQPSPNAARSRALVPPHVQWTANIAPPVGDPATVVWSQTVPAHGAPWAASLPHGIPALATALHVAPRFGRFLVLSVPAAAEPPPPRSWGAADRPKTPVPLLVPALHPLQVVLEQRVPAVARALRILKTPEPESPDRLAAAAHAVVTGVLDLWFMARGYADWVPLLPPPGILASTWPHPDTTPPDPLGPSPALAPWMAYLLAANQIPTAAVALMRAAGSPGPQPHPCDPGQLPQGSRNALQLAWSAHAAMVRELAPWSPVRGTIHPTGTRAAVSQSRAQARAQDLPDAWHSAAYEAMAYLSAALVQVQDNN